MKPARSRPRRTDTPFAEETQGVTHLLETMIAGIMVVGAVVAVATVNLPVSTTEGFKTQQQELSQNTLDALAAQPSRDNRNVVFGSLLEEYVMKAVSGDKAPLMDYLNSTLPSGSQYNVLLNTGFGSPVKVVQGGSPPGESWAGSRSFVPKMSYVFMIPEFSRYQGNFHMNVLSIPMHSNIVQQDEGEPVEVDVTFRSGSKKSVTLQANDRTALRYNDPQGRSWASASLYTIDPSDPWKTPTYYLDATDVQPYQHPEPKVDLGGKTAHLGEAYNITIPIIVEETADHPIPRGARISVEFPRGWDFPEDRRKWIEQGTGAGNADYWTDFDWTGSIGEGWTVSAALKNPLRNDQAFLSLTGDYRLNLDPAYPYFQPVTTWMSGGVQGKSTILVQTGTKESVEQSADPKSLGFSGEGVGVDEEATALLLGGLRRDIYTSTPKPLISGKDSTWGISFANTGEEVTIEKIDVRQPKGLPLIQEITATGSWEYGKWKQSGPGNFTWTPDTEQKLGRGEAAWWSFKATGGPTRDNHYRNHDYQDVLLNFSPDRTTSPDAHDNWTFTQRSHHQSGQTVYRQLVPPAQTTSGWPGWPNEAESYWFNGEAKQQNRFSVGNASYLVDLSGAFAEAFGDYQGSHVYSDVHTENSQGQAQRIFHVGDRVHVKNDFSALFSRLSMIREDPDRYPDLTISDVNMKTSIYTPDRAWTGTPTKTFQEQAEIALSFGEFKWIFPLDITGNNILDIVLVNGDGLVYALDGRDGAKLWALDTLRTVTQATLTDLSGDGHPELVFATSENHLYAYNTQLNPPSPKRLLWSQNLKSSILGMDGNPPYQVSAIQDLTQGKGTAGAPAFAVAISASSGGSQVILVNQTNTPSGPAASIVATHTSSTAVTNDVRLSDLALAFDKDAKGKETAHLVLASLNQTITKLALPTLEPVWITKLPHSPMTIETGDLYGDGWADVVVNTGPKSTSDDGGDYLYVLPGQTGVLGPAARDLGFVTEENIRPKDAVILDDGRALVVAGHPQPLHDQTGFYNPTADSPIACDGNPEGGLSDLLDGQRWTAIHVDETVETKVIYIISERGAILKAEKSCDFQNTFDWEVVDDGEDMFSDEGKYIAVHANETVAGSLELHRMSKEGVTESLGWDGWTHNGKACNSGYIDCSEPYETIEWHVEESAMGGAHKFWALIVENPDKTNNQEATSHLLSLNRGIFGEWSVWEHHRDWPGIALNGLHVEPSGDQWVYGSGADGSPYVSHKPSNQTTWSSEEFINGEADGNLQREILDVLPTESGDRWALDNHGDGWRQLDGHQWVIFPTRHGSSESGVLTEDPDGTPWAFLDHYHHLPLNNHMPWSKAVVPSSLNIENSGAVTVRIESEEAHLGGDDDPDTASPLTEIEWYVRETGKTWHRIPKDEGASPDGLPGMGQLDLHTYTTTLQCAKPCKPLELQAILNSNTLTENGELRQDSSMTPLLRKTGITLQAALEDGSQIVFDEYEPEQLLGNGTEAVYSSFLQGLILKDQQASWAYPGLQNTGNPYAQGTQHRFAEPGNLLGDAVSLAIVEQGTEGIHTRVLDGTTGLPLRPTSGYHKFSTDNELGEVLIGDLTGDGTDNVALLGKFDGGMQAGQIWDTQSDSWEPVETVANDPVITATLTGPAEGRQSITFALPSAQTVLVGGEEQLVGNIVSWLSGSSELDSTLRWKADPLRSQGLTTFSYPIPRNAFPGTSILVSEMAFDMTRNNQTVTQTARLLDWFDILPPDRTKSVPPVYTVEVVAWMEEL